MHSSCESNEILKIITRNKSCYVKFRFFSRKVKSPEAKAKTPEPITRGETERIARPAPVGKASKSATVHVSSVRKLQKLD